ncbi:MULTISPECIES: hypothetical protein [unclassified Streptomyces]|uniref:hypothetical protein n=1 Tax=unclassified Streptomyces TaxID=2593676 RepID=UPI001F04B1A5|nr:MULTISPECIES: hypothetical protein [unclassified Streptomyces]MCH0562410.1 hypothetical protein [Streptomyces sp. MUM 2J]MCH0570502.1 hypothetical protein [Streptomyces sp. MUM 136J]
MTSLGSPGVIGPPQLPSPAAGPVPPAAAACPDRDAGRPVREPDDRVAVGVAPVRARAPAAAGFAEAVEAVLFVPVADPPAAVLFFAARRGVPVVEVPAPVVDRLAAPAPAAVFLAVRGPVPPVDPLAPRVPVPVADRLAAPVPVPAGVLLVVVVLGVVLLAVAVPGTDFLAAAVEVLAVLPPPAVDTIASALVLRAARIRARSARAAGWPTEPVADAAAPSSPLPCSRDRACVNQATAAPVRATGHSTTPATPSTPAPVYTASLRRRGDTRSTAARAPPAARPAVPAPGILCSTETVARSGCGRPDEVS